jgi:hypothetical protein
MLLLRATLLTMMSPAEIFAIAVGGLISLLFCAHLSAKCLFLIRHSKLRFTQHFEKVVFGKLSWLRPRTFWKLLAQFVWIGTNIVIAFYGFENIRTTARKAGEVAMIDMGLFYLGPNLSYQADSLHLSLTHLQSIHRGITTSFIILATFHVIVLRPTQSIFVSGQSTQLYGVIVCGPSSASSRPRPVR